MSDIGDLSPSRLRGYSHGSDGSEQGDTMAMMTDYNIQRD